MTARWVVESVAPHRDLSVTWQPISLLLKNQPSEGSRSHQAYTFTHNLLRVMESVRAAYGDAAVHPLYFELGRRIHHERERDFAPEPSLERVGLDPAHGAAFDDAGWDGVIARRMNQGLELAGTDIGTPIIGFDDGAAHQVGIFGPVITRVPPPDRSLELWDAVVTLATTDGFWELKRTRTERPSFGAPPEIAPYAAG